MSAAEAHLRRLDAIPLTASGKVDGDALRSELHPSSSERPFREPEGPVEEYLAHTWQKELGTDRVGADDDFFELGGTSLGAMQIMLRLCREFDLDLPLATIFSHTTLRQLARVSEDKLLADASELVADEQP